MRINSECSTRFSMTKTHLIEIYNSRKYRAVRRADLKKVFGFPTVLPPIKGYYFENGKMRARFDIRWAAFDYGHAFNIGCKQFIGEDLAKLKKWATK